MIDHNNLEEYHDPINYDLEFGGETKKHQFNVERAKATPGAVVELACGCGLTILPLAEDLPVGIIEPDARTIRLDERFAMIYLTGNAFQAFLSDEDQAALLRAVQEETAWGLLVDQDGQNVQVLGTHTYDSSRSNMQWAMFRDWDDKRTPSRTACRFTDHDALAGMSTRHGFRIEHQYADWGRTPSDHAAPSIIGVCRADDV